jgi:NitT/TauT family transport system substrate-binding protein
MKRSAVLAALGAAAVAHGRASAQTASPVKLASGTVEANAQGFYAQDAGFFRKAGVDVQITVLRSGPTIAAAVIGGDQQVGVSNVISLASARLRGIPMSIIAPGGIFDAKDATEEVVVLKDGPIHTAQDLNGKVVGGQSIGSTAHLALLAWIDKNGGDASSVKYIEVPPSASLEALQQNRIYAVALQDPQLSAAAPYTRKLGRAYEAVAKTYVLAAWFAMDAWLKQNAATARRIADALEQAGQWAMSNPVEAAAIFEKYTKVHLAKAGEQFTPVNDPAMYQPIFDSAAKYKILPSKLNANDILWNGK